jgi:hypothetical protein
MSSKAKSLSEDSHFNGVNNVYFVIFSLLLIDQQVWGISLGDGPIASHWLEDFACCLPTTIIG